MEQKQDIVLYQIDNANVCVSVFYKDETFWLTRMSMAELFGVGPQAISKHLGNIYKEDELDRESTSSKMKVGLRKNVMLIFIISMPLLP